MNRRRRSNRRGIGRPTVAGLSLATAAIVAVGGLTSAGPWLSPNAAGAVASAATPGPAAPSLTSGSSRTRLAGNSTEASATAASLASMAPTGGSSSDGRPPTLLADRVADGGASAASAGLAADPREGIVRLRNLGCRGVSTGSGFAIGDGYLVTNRHVVADAQRVEVESWDGEDLGSAEVVWTSSDDELDLALLRIGRPLVALPLGAAGGAGQHLTVDGFPRGRRYESHDVSLVEVVSGTAAPILAIDGDVEPGNSGSPVLNDDGRVVAVVYARRLNDGRALAIDSSALAAVRAAAAKAGPPAPAVCR